MKQEGVDYEEKTKNGLSGFDSNAGGDDAGGNVCRDGSDDLRKSSGA